MSTSQVLIGSKTSPYVRRFRLWLHGRMKFDLKLIDYINVPEDATFLKTVSPINKIPVWIDGEKKIFESRVIANYLNRKNAWEPLSLEEENMLSFSDAAADVAINLFLLRRGGTDFDGVHGKNWYIERQRERLPSIFEQLEPWAKSRDEKNPDHWNYSTASLFSFVDWAEFRGTADFTAFPGLTDFVKRFSHKPGVAESSPRT
jgi:glutathione S-transferase